MSSACLQCNRIFYDNLSYMKHMWREHPSNEVERYWSKLEKSGELYSGRYNMGYIDDPYH